MPIWVSILNASFSGMHSVSRMDRRMAYGQGPLAEIALGKF